MRVLQVGVELGVEVVRRLLGERSLDRPVKAGGQPLGHRPLLVPDALCGPDRLRVAGALGDADQQLVRGELESSYE
ncbi:MAG TPA: hypothetical protein VE984_08485 [Gaiellaceae bacterium]|nr:hypothetical protein [Gaiellaceae bacterium]